MEMQGTFMAWNQLLLLPASCRNGLGGGLSPSVGQRPRSLPALVALVGSLLASGIASAGPWRTTTDVMLAAGTTQQFIVEDQNDLESSFFLPIPREDRLRLMRIEEYTKEKRWTDAAQDLIDLLAAEDTEDFLVPLDGQGETTSESVKTSTLKLVKTLPPDVLEAYTLLVGGEPDVMLQEALATNDQRKLANVARRFLFTPDGEKAAIILARKAMDAQQWEGALLDLKRLDFKPPKTRRYQAETDLMTAICLYEVGQVDQAVQKIDDLKESRELSKLLPPALAKLSTGTQILQKLIHVGSLSEFPPYAWTMFQGSESRTAPSRGSEPLQEIQWNARMAQSAQQQDDIRNSIQRLRDNRVPAFPSVHPVVVGGQVIFRTPAGLLATDIQSGKVLWKFPWDTIELELNEEEPDILSTILPGLPREFERSIWFDARSGLLSSDGSRLYYVHEERPARDDLSSVFARGAFNVGGLLSGQGNHLYCFDIQREGAILWQLGGVASDAGQEENQLSEARFLGPPLPVGNDLFVLAGIIDEIRLLSLDAETGKIHWSQQLARQTSGSPDDLMTTLLQSATPSHKGGILVCPTNSGAIVAIDLANRTLLWGFQYKEPTRIRANRRTSSNQGNDLLATADRWTDGTPVIHQGKVLITPTDSDYLYCLDLLTGEKQWQRPRQDNVALAAVHKDIALVVGKTGVTGIDIESGEPAWTPEESPFPEQAMPSGFGFRLEGEYYQPTTVNQILPIDIATGEQDEPIEAVGELGNLVCYQDYVISVSPEYVTAFKQIDALRREVTARLATNPDDAEALRMYGKLQKHDGDLAGAITSLRRSLELAPSEETRTQFVSTALAALNEDFRQFRSVAGELSDLVDSIDERMSLARLTARGLHTEEEREEALSLYFRFLDLTDEYLSDQVVPNEMIIKDFDPGVEVTSDRWARGQISQLYDQMTSEEKAAADIQVQERLARLREQGGDPTQALARFVNRFPRFPAAQDARVELASLHLQAGQTMQGEALVRSLIEDDLPPQELGPLIYQLAKNLDEGGLGNESAKWYARLSQQYADVPVDGSRTGRQVAVLPQWNSVERKLARGKPVWPYSDFEAKAADEGTAGFDRVDHPIRLQEHNEDAPTDYSLLLDSDANLIIVRDEFGNPVVRIPFTPLSGRRLYIPQINALHAQQTGHLLIVSLGSELQAFNMMPRLPGDSSARLVWNADLQHGLGGTTRRTREFEVNSKHSNPFADMEAIAEDVTTDKPIGQFACRDDLVCYQVGSQLVCRDPLTGEVFWKRDGMELGCTLIATEKKIVAIPKDPNASRNQMGDVVQAWVLSADNGQLLDMVELPSSDRIWTVADGVVLAWQKRPVEGPQGLEAFDATTGKQVWARSYEADSSTKGSVLKRQPGLVLLDRTGRLQLIDIPSGEVISEHIIVQSSEPIQLKTVESDDQFLVAVYHPVPPRPHFRSIPYEQSELLLRGEIYALDNQTGEMNWNHPVQIHDSYLLEKFQSSGLPVLAMVAKLHRPDARTPQNTSATEVLLVDKRDGRLLYRGEFGGRSVTFGLSGDPAKSSVTLQLPENKVTLTFDPDTPPVPAPPATTAVPFAFPPQKDEPQPQP